MMDGLATLNGPQREAVRTLAGPLLVLAGAGTGKTRVITYRMAELIRSGIQPDRILSVTFTNKAAKEMQQRSAELLGKRMKRKPLVSTFHSFCVKVLRADIEVLGYPAKFTIYDRGDQESTARKALRDIRVTDKSMRPADLLGRISRWKMAGVAPELATEYVDNDMDFLSAVAFRKYQQHLKAAGAVDFDDLLLLTVQLFREDDSVLQRWQTKFDHVQIDEYQDTNGVQFELISSLVEPHCNLCVVGDDDQSIYGWRGAEVEHILSFERHFPGAKVIRLEDNYRCTDKILELANNLVRHNRGRHDKRLIPHKIDGPGVRCFHYDDENAEAENVVGEIAYLIRELDVQPRDFAILFRTNEQPRVFETELRRQNVPYVLVGGQSFFDRRETRDLMAYLKFIDNENDETSLRRIINTPARGIGDGSIQKLLQHAVRTKRTLWQVLHDEEACGMVPPRVREGIRRFRELIGRYRSAMIGDPEQLGRFMANFIQEIDYQSEIEKQYKQAEQQTARRAVVEDMVQSLSDYVDRTAEPALSQFLEQSALSDRHEESDKESKVASNAIKLMTLHAAKGLEFPRVYLAGLEEGLLPHRRSVEATTRQSKRNAASPTSVLHAPKTT